MAKAPEPERPAEDADVSGKAKPDDRELRPPSTAHVLISCPLEHWPTLAPLVATLEANPYVTVRSGANAIG